MDRCLKKLKRELPLHMMLLPGVILIFVFHYIPLGGVVIAFQKFMPAKGLFGNQQWVGLDNFRYLFAQPNMTKVIRNTLTIATGKIVLSSIVPVAVALMLNEVKKLRYKRLVQTFIYFPHFLSWIIMAVILHEILSPSSGIVNQILGLFGVAPIHFLGSNECFQGTMVVTDIWKEFGYGTVVYLAAITSIDPELYDAAAIDGAGRLRQTWHVTLPGMREIIVLLMVLKMDGFLNAGFDQIYNLYSPAVYQTGDILDTMIYRMGLISAQYGPAAAAGLFKSAISFVLISISYYIAYKLFDYRLF